MSDSVNGSEQPRGRVSAVGNSLLLVLVFTTVFILPLFPTSSHLVLYNLANTGIYLLATLAIERYRRALLSMALTVIVVEWVSELLDLPLLNGVSLTPEAIEERFSELIYYAFVTMTTVGYGDLLPLTSQSRSLAVLMGMTGQLYLAVVLATLVGKYSSRSREDGEE